MPGCELPLMPEPAAPRITAGSPSSPGCGREGAKTGVEAFLAILGTAMNAIAGGDARGRGASDPASADAGGVTSFPEAAAPEEGDEKPPGPGEAGFPAPPGIPLPMPATASVVPAAFRDGGPAPAAPAIPGGAGVSLDGMADMVSSEPGPAGPIGFISPPGRQADGPDATPSLAAPAATLPGAPVRGAESSRPAPPAAVLTEAPASRSSSPQETAFPPVALHQGAPDAAGGGKGAHPVPVSADSDPGAGSAAGGGEDALASRSAAPGLAAAMPAPAPRTATAARAPHGLTREPRALPAGNAPAVDPSAVAAPRTSPLPGNAPPLAPEVGAVASAALASATPGPTPRDATPEPPATHGLAAAASLHAPAPGFVPVPEQASAPPAPLPPHVQIARALEPFALDRRPDASATLSVRLEPADLGQVEVRLEPTRDGTLRVEIIAERPETMALLQRERHDLLRALDRAGLSTNDQPTFGAGGGAGSEADRQPPQRWAQGHPVPGRHTGNVPETPVLRPAPARPVHRVAGRIDLIA